MSLSHREEIYDVQVYNKYISSVFIEIRACHHPKNVEICRQVDFKESSVESKISAGFFSI